MSSSNRVSLRYGDEVSYGVVPTPPSSFKLKTLRFTSEGLGQDNQTIASDELRSDRQVSDVTLVNTSSSGPVNGILSYGTYDDFLQKALCSAAWTSPTTLVNAATTVAFNGTTQVVTAAAGAFSSVAVGDWVRISGATNPANNTVAKVLAVTGGNQITVGRTTVPIVTETAGASVTIVRLSQITNGTTVQPFYIEKQFEDLTNVFEQLFGNVINQASITLALGQPIRCVFTMVGSKAPSGTATLGDGSPTPATTTPTMNAVGNVALISDGSSGASSLCFQSVNIEIGNNFRTTSCIGKFGAQGVTPGQVNITGGLRTLFASSAMIDQFINYTTSFFVTQLVDSLGNRYVIDIPAIKYTNGRRVAGGLNQDVVADMSWSAILGATEGYMMRIVRIPAV